MQEIFNIYICQIYKVREFKEEDSKNVFYFLFDILVNEFNIALDFNNLDSDLMDINNRYNKDEGGCFWVVERKNDGQINWDRCNNKVKRRRI